MIVIKNLTLKNFLSIGQVTQAIDFNRTDLTLILGENLDLGGDGARNGTGKTTIIQGLSYALFGTAINQIKKDNLINRTNGKAMVATVDFSVRGVDYRIVRGRKPNILKFYVNNQEQSAGEGSDDSQGDSRETQDAIERVLCMTPDMFRQIVALNTYNEPFLAMKVSDQRNIIEQLLGITLLSEKAEAIKELNKQTKDNIQQEEYRVRGLEEANKRIQEQIDSLRKRQRLWTAKRDEDLAKFVAEYDALAAIDITAELQAHRDLVEYNAKVAQLERYNSLLARQTAWKQKRDGAYIQLERDLNELQKIDIVAELAAHEQLLVYNQLVKDAADHARNLKRSHDDCANWAKQAQKLTEEIHELQEHRCYACGQEFHDAKHAEVLTKKQTQLTEAETNYNTTLAEWQSLTDNPVVVPVKPVTHYKTQAEALQHSNSIASVQQRMADNRAEADPYADQLAESAVTVKGKPPKTHYDTEEEAIKHSGRVSTLLEQIANKHAEQDPYAEQITEMESKGIQTVNFDEINRLTRLLQHQEYLLDLLTNKKSFVRKRIIEQNLSYLNARLTHYLDKMGLPHQVVFQNDLSVEITELGRELDFDNLSRGERNRLILGLSFAFRDVWENLYSPINVLFVDELIDNGLDTIGVENSIALLKDMTRRRQKSIWLVSHRDELTNRVSSVLKVIKEGGFTSYNTSSEYTE
jgi:DNA repair exonuclease SbcCD ATPase subunit